MAIKVHKNSYLVDKDTKTSVKVEISEVEKKLLAVDELIKTTVSNKDFNITNIVNQRNVLTVKLTQAKKKLELLGKFGKSLGVYIQERGNGIVGNLED